MLINCLSILSILFITSVSYIRPDLVDLSVNIVPLLKSADPFEIILSFLNLLGEKVLPESIYKLLRPILLCIGFLYSLYCVYTIPCFISMVLIYISIDSLLSYLPTIPYN